MKNKIKKLNIFNFVTGQSPVTLFKHVTGQSPVTLFKHVTGQSLIEVLLIVVLVTTVIAGSVGFLVESYSMTQFISDQTVATYLGTEGIEIVKNLIDANYINNNAFNAKISKGAYEVDYLSSDLEIDQNRKLFFDSQTNAYGYDSISLSAGAKESIYSRKITIDNFEGGVIVKSIVSWTGKRCPVSGCSIFLEAYFYDWR